MHSRAAKRASSPSIDTDKSLKNVKPPAESSNHRPSVLAVHQGAGVTKKSKNGRKSVLSAKAKRRQEKGLDRAEAVMDKKVIRIEKSRGKARNVQDRAKAWEEQNKKALLALKAAELKDQERPEDWEDEEDEENEEGDSENIEGDVQIEDAPSVTDADATTNEVPAEDEDEIL